jgi:two-component system, NarL family, sensor kinase
MQDQSPEIYFIIVIGAVLALLLVGFIVSILFLYQRRQHRQEQELTRMREEYEREVLRSQLEIQEESFKTIGQELHDNIGQMLSVVKLSLAVLPLPKEHEAFEPIQNSRQILNKAMTDLADLTKSLHTDRIAQIGLADSIQFELESLRRSGLVEIDFSISGSEQHLDEQKSIFLFRIFQENMNNILKHARAKQVTVSLQYSDDEFVMQIADDGIGFDVQAKKNSALSTAGVGLKSIFNRAKLIGAVLDMQSEPGKGTTVTIRMPLTAAVVNEQNNGNR